MTPTCRVAEEMALAGFPPPWGRCLPLAESGQWKSGLTSVPQSSTKPPVGFRNAHVMNLGLHPTRVSLPGFSTGLSLECQGKWPEFGQVQ